jgi:predicted DCC family thiol-disulfide oxidoreductase YuxK
MAIPGDGDQAAEGWRRGVVFIKEIVPRRLSPLPRVCFTMKITRRTQRCKIMIEPGKDHMLFDGDCGICTRSAEIAGRMDQRFIIEPYQAYPEDELKKFGITYAKCAKNLQVISERGRVHAGAFAVNYFLWRQFPWSLLVILIYAVPVLLLLEVIGYRLVERNRYRLSQWFGLKACRIVDS